MPLGSSLLRAHERALKARRGREVGDFFPMKQVYTHQKGHDVPRDGAFLKRFQDFVSQQL